jgi:ABC-type amino acid transport substrate-binding protein
VRRTSHLLAALLALVAVVVLAAGCGGDDDDGGAGTGTTGGTSELQTRDPGKLILGSDIPFPPFEFGRKPDYKGFDIDLVREIATRLELDLEIQDTPFDTIFRDLAQGKFDMVASATTITEEREGAVDFANPYFAAEQSLLVREGSDIRTVEDLAGTVVGAQNGTTGADYAKEETEAENVRTYDTYDTAYNALVAGQIDAVIADLPAAQDAVEAKDRLEIAMQIDTGEQYGFAFQEDADDLREAVNGALDEMRQDGTYEEIYQEYFDKAPPAEILEATHEPT